MSEAENALHTTMREWVQKAENDLKSAEAILALGEKCPTDGVCFHAQQCIEKYIKALLVANKLDFPKTHDINALILLLPESMRPPIDVFQGRRLTDYAANSRYPDSFVEIPLAEARGAMELVRSIRGQIRRSLRALHPGLVLPGSDTAS